jgi:hypothetical protein
MSTWRLYKGVRYLSCSQQSALVLLSRRQRLSASVEAAYYAIGEDLLELSTSHTSSLSATLTALTVDRLDDS